jgi:hypothetical protein
VAGGTPFPFEGPVAPDRLIDRRDELELLARRAADRVSVRLVAPRRFGKTSLLLAHARRMQASGYRTAHVDLGRVTDLVDVARRLAQAYAQLDARAVRAHFGGLLRRIGLQLGTTGASISLAPRSSAVDAPAAEEVVLVLLDLPKSLHDADGYPSLVVFDEFQDLLVARRDLDGLLRSRIQYHGDACAYIYAGSEPSMMRELFDRRERPLFGQADPLELGPLPGEEVLDELGHRFADEQLDPGAALDGLVGFAEGHPQRTMLLAYLLADRLQAGQTGTAETAEHVLDDALARTQPAHQALWGQLDATERIVLAAAADGVSPTSRALAETHRLARRSLELAANRLADKGHLRRIPRASRPVDPLLAEWLRRR